MSGEYPGIFGPEHNRKAPCPECAKETRVDTLFMKLERWDLEGPGISGVVEHYVFQCRGCEEVFFSKSSGNSEEYYDYYDQYTGEQRREYEYEKSFWPTIAQTQVPDWAQGDLAKEDKILFDLLNSIYTAMNSNLGVLAAIGMRTAFDRVSEVLKVQTTLSFEDKLEELRKKGHISGAQKGVLTVLIDAGSAAAHRGWKPKDSQLSTMKEILEALIRDHFILKSDVAELKANIPAKKAS